MDTISKGNTSPTASRITLTIKFPPYYPFQSRTLDFNPKFTIQEALTYIILALHLENFRKPGTVGKLFVPEFGVYLDNQDQLCNLKFLNNVSHLLFKEEDIVETVFSKSKQNNHGCHRSCNSDPHLELVTDLPSLQESVNVNTPSEQPETLSIDLNAVRALTTPSNADVQHHLTNLASPTTKERFFDLTSSTTTDRLYWVTKLLEEKERDLQLAAEIGKALLIKNEQLTHQLDVVQRQNQDLEERLKALDELRIRNEKLQSRLIFLEAEVADAAKVNQQLMQELQDRDNEIRSLKQKFQPEAAVSHRNVLSERVAELTESLESTKIELENVKKKLLSLQQQNESLLNQKETLQNEKEKLTSTVEKLHSERRNVEELNKTVDSLQKKNRTLELELRKTKSLCLSINALEQLFRSSSFTINTRDDDLRLLEATRKMLNQMEETLKNMNSIRFSELDSLSAENEPNLDGSTQQHSNSFLFNFLLSKINFIQKSVNIYSSLNVESNRNSFVNNPLVNNVHTSPKTIINEFTTEAETPEDDFVVTFLMVALMALEKLVSLEAQIKQLTTENCELQEDLNELREQLSKEQSFKTSLQYTKEMLKEENELLKRRLREIEQKQNCINTNKEPNFLNNSQNNTDTNSKTFYSTTSIRDDIQQYKQKEEDYLLQIKSLQEKNNLLLQENERLAKCLPEQTTIDSHNIATKLEETTRLLLETQKLYTEQLHEIKEELKRKQSEISLFQDSERKLNETTQRLNKEIAEKQSIITSLQHDLYEKIKVISQLQNEITQLNLILEQKNNEFFVCKETVRKLESEIQNLLSQITLSKTILEQQQQRHIEEKEKLRCELETKEQTIRALQHEVTKLTETIQQKEQDLILDSQIAQLEAMNPNIQLEIKLKFTEEENVCLKEMNKKLQAALDRETDTAKNLQLQLASKNEELVQKTKRVNELENELQKLKTNGDQRSQKSESPLPDAKKSEKDSTKKFLDFGY
jgi:hypothetical protein